MSAARRKLLAKVHVAKKQLCLDDDTYRSVLLRVAGAESSGELDDARLGAVLGEFRRLGWRPKTASGKRPSDRRQVRYIWALWNELGSLGLINSPTRAALRTFVQNHTGVSDPEWLTVRQGSAVVEGLRAWKRTLERKSRGAQ